MAFRLGLVLLLEDRCLVSRAGAVFADFLLGKADGFQAEELADLTPPGGFAEIAEEAQLLLAGEEGGGKGLVVEADEGVRDVGSDRTGALDDDRLLAVRLDLVDDGAGARFSQLALDDELLGRGGEVERHADLRVAGAAARADVLRRGDTGSVERPFDRLEKRGLADAVGADDADRGGRRDGDVVIAGVLLVVGDLDPADDHLTASSSGATASWASIASSRARSPRSRNSVAKDSL